MRPHGKFVTVDPTRPEAQAVCDRCGFWYNRSDLVSQVYWAGQHIYATSILVCTTGNRCFDIPNEQLRTIILPPDPPPIINARVPNYQYEEQIPLIAQQGLSDPTNSGAIIPWGTGPELLLSDQSGDIVLLAQYTQSQQLPDTSFDTTVTVLGGVPVRQTYLTTDRGFPLTSDDGTPLTE